MNRKRCVRHLQKAVESLCQVSFPRFISATASAESLYLHSLTGSRAVCDFYAASNACGGHTYMTNLISSFGSEPPKFPKGDIFVAFDNQQVIGKEYRVTLGGGQRTSVVTTVTVFQEAASFNVQSNLPTLTRLPVPSSEPEVLMKMYLQQGETWKNQHRTFRNQWIEARLRRLLLELAQEGGNLENNEVLELIKEPNYESGLEYTRVPSSTSSCSATDMQSIIVNPNSTVTVRQVIDVLLEMNEKSDPERKWFPLYCDGLPYGIVWNLVHSIYICQKCKACDVEAVLKDHPCGFDSCQPKYQKILLRPGLSLGKITDMN